MQKDYPKSEVKSLDEIIKKMNSASVDVISFDIFDTLLVRTIGSPSDFFELLDCNRQIGVSLNDSLLMTPSKSVTAIFGIGTCVGAAVEQKCLTCRKTDCEFRRGQ